MTVPIQYLLEGADEANEAVRMLLAENEKLKAELKRKDKDIKRNKEREDCVITASKDVVVKDSNDIGVYLQWNGGRDSVEAFLTYCKLKGYRPPDMDDYGWARLCQVVGNFFGGGASVGVDRCCKLDCDNWDNGVYIIEGWDIVGRKYFTGLEQDENDLEEMLMEIDKCMPEREQLGEEAILHYLKERIEGD